MNMPNNMDMAALMSMLSKMHKKQLEQGLSRMGQMLSSEEKDKLMKALRENMPNQ